MISLLKKKSPRKFYVDTALVEAAAKRGAETYMRREAERQFSEQHYPVLISMNCDVTFLPIPDWTANVPGYDVEFV